MVTLKHFRPAFYSQQDGFAAFAVTLIMIIVLSLIVLGFASSSRSEQRRALDQQLSTSAYYAAESGINDAYAVIEADYKAGILPIGQTSCNLLGSPYGTPTQNTLDAGSGVQVTCLLVDPQPPSLEYAPINTGHGQVVPVFGRRQISHHNFPVKAITISWEQHGGGSGFTGCPNAADTFPSEAVWLSRNCGAGMLQVDIVPASGWISRADLQNQTKTVFLEPLRTGANNRNVPVTNGAVAGLGCSSSSSLGEYACTATLNSLPPAPGGKYYLHITPIYLNADVSVTAYKTAGFGSGVPSGRLDLYNAQALIDSTGKANDELKRIQERVAINPVGNNDVPVNALQSRDGICKRFTARPGVVTGSGAPAGC